MLEYVTGHEDVVKLFTCLCDYQNISEDYLIAYKVLPAVSHIYVHQKSTTVAYVLEVIVIDSL